MNLGSITWDVEVGTTDLKKADADMDKAADSAEDLRKKTKKTGDQATKTGKQYKRAASDIKKGFGGARTAVKAFAAALISIGLVRGLRSTITATNQFNASVSELSAITGAVGEDLEFFAEQSKLIGRTTTLSASQAVQAFKLIASAKPDLLSSATALAAVTQEAVTLAEAAKIDLTEAANAVGTSLNQFGKGASEANRFINILAAGSKFGASAITDTTMALKNSGAAANAAGLSFEETNAAIQGLAAGGLKAAEAGTGLRNIILILEQEADLKLRPSIVGLTAAMENLAAKELGLIEMTDIFGRMNVVAAQTLVDNAGSLAALEKNLTGTTVATEQAAINFDNLSGDVLASKSATEGLQIALGDKLTPALRDITQDFTILLNKITEFVETDEFLEWVGLASDALKVLSAVIVTKLLISVGSAVTTFIAAQVSLTAFTASMVLAAGPLGILFLVGSLAALAIAYFNVQEAQEEMRAETIGWISGDGGLVAVDFAIQDTIDQIGKLEEAIEGERGGIFSHFIGSDMNKARDEIKLLESFLADLREEQERLTIVQDEADAVQKAVTDSVGVLRMENQKLVEVTEDLFHVGSMLNTEVQQTTFQMRGVTFATDLYTQTTIELLSELEQEIEDLKKTERELFILAQTRALDEGATIDEIAAIRLKAGALFDERTEIEATAKAEATATAAAEANLKKLEVESGRVKEEIERQWTATRDTFAGFFIDMFDNGKGAFESLLGSFKAMVKQMVAQWLGSGLMKLFGMSGGGAAASGGFSLFGGAGGSGGGAGGLLNAGTSLLGGGGSGGSGLISGALATGGQFLAGLGGSATGIAAGTVGPPTAAAIAGANVAGFGSSALALATNPVTLAILAAAGIATLLDDSGTMSHNAGFLLSQPAGVDPSRIFDVAPFASGFDPVGFMRRSSKDDALGIIESFRLLDAGLTQAAIALGINPSLSATSFGGYSEKGTGSGLFFGSASEDGGGNGTPLGEQLNRYASQWIIAAGGQAGIGQAAINALIGEGTAGGILSRANSAAGIDGSFRSGLNRVPFDGFIAELHEGERIQSNSQARQQDSAQAAGTSEDGSFFSMIKNFMMNFNLLYTIIDKWDGQGIPKERIDPT